MFEETYTYLVIIIIFLLGPIIYDLWKQHKWAENKKEPAVPTAGLYRTLLAYGVIFLLAIVIFQLMVTITSYIRPLPDTMNALKPYLNSTVNQGNMSILTLIKSNNDAIANLNGGLVDIVKTIITLLGGALSAIIGFYFGNKAATDVKQQHTGTTPPTETKTPPTETKTPPTETKTPPKP